MAKKIIFLSHAHEDAEVAKALKNLIEDAFAEMIEVFVSSDPRSLLPGKLWENELWLHLENAIQCIVVLSPIAMHKPWVIFEAGFARGKKIEVTPVCIKGLEIADVGLPLNAYQLLSLNSDEAIKLLINTIAKDETGECRAKPNQELINKVIDMAKAPKDDLALQLSSVNREHESELLAEIISKISELTSARSIFWEILTEKYVEHYKGQKGYPETIQALAELAPSPLGLPLEGGENLRDYLTQHGLFLRDDAKRIYNFCAAVYPPKHHEKSLAQCSIISEERFYAFHQARGDHSNFWRGIGLKVYETRNLGLDTIASEFSAQLPMINLLCYLEVALVQWTQEGGSGKDRLFRLNRDWHRLKELD